MLELSKVSGGVFCVRGTTPYAMACFTQILMTRVRNQTTGATTIEPAFDWSILLCCVGEMDASKLTDDEEVSVRASCAPRTSPTDVLIQSFSN